MKQIQNVVMQASYILGLICLLGGTCVRILWQFHLALGFRHQSWFTAACAFFLCALASYRLSRSETS